MDTEAQKSGADEHTPSSTAVLAARGYPWAFCIFVQWDSIKSSLCTLTSSNPYPFSIFTYSLFKCIKAGALTPLHVHSKPLDACSNLGLVHCRTKHQLQLCSPQRQESQGAVKKESDFSPPHTWPETVVIQNHWGRKEFGEVEPSSQGSGH